MMHRFVIAILLAATAHAQTSDSAKTARISGRVVDQSGKPVRKAMVKLLGASVYTQAADAQGTFTVDKVAPGTYSLVAYGPGFTPQKYGAEAPLLQTCRYVESLSDATLTVGLKNLRGCIQGASGEALSLSAGAELKDLTVKMTRRATITGRVLNRSGEPAAGWAVLLLRVAYVDGKKQLQGSQLGMATDVDGNFAIADVGPGRCYLYAMNQRANMFAGLNSERAGKGDPEIDLPGYYPGSAEWADAKPIDVKPGAELTGMDILLPRGRVYAIRGKVEAGSGAGLSDQILTLYDRNAPATVGTPKSSRVYADGSFEFANVPAGNYVISGGMAWANAGAAPPVFAHKEVAVYGEDVAGLTLHAVPMLEITGSVKLEHGELKEMPSVNLREIGGPLSSFADTDPSGNLKFRQRIAPVTYVVSVPRIPAGTYLKSMRFGKQDLMQGPLDLTGGAGGSIEVLFSSNVAAVEGVVKNAANEPARGVVVTVWPRVRSNGLTARSTSTDQNGDFELTGLAPGQYFVAAWENVDPALLENPDFLPVFQPRATAITVEENGRAKVNPAIMAAKLVTEEAEKLP